VTVQLRVVPQPVLIGWRDWVDSVVGYNPGLIMQVSPDLSWQEFANRLAQVVPQTPDHRMFEDWRAWVEALRRAVL
jgi:hypothetical protein